MGINGIGGAQQAHTAYAQLQKAQEREPAQAAQAAAQSARVQKRTFGFSLGKLGIKYTEADIEFKPQQPQETKRTSRAFNSAMDNTEIYGQMNRQAASSAPPPEPNDSALNRRQALEAYAQSSLDSLAHAASNARRTIGKV